MASKDSSNKDQKDQKVGSNISPDSVRVYGESMGISSLPDDAASFLAEQMTYLLKTIIQDSKKHMYHSKRKRMSTADMDMALKSKGFQPLFGMKCADPIPFRFASGGGRELHFYDDKEVDLAEIMTAPLPKVPQEVTLKAHWLSVEGVQPAIPENPPAASKEMQKKEILDVGMKNLIDKGHKLNLKPGTSASASGAAAGGGGASAAVRQRLKRKRPTGGDMVQLKALTPHELSREQQFFYKEVTEACVGPEENKRSEALNSLANDPGLHQMLPRFIAFVAEGVRINVAQNNLALLIYLMRMAKSILDNPHLYLEKHLHMLIPAVVTCVVSRQLCVRPESDNHWALRDFAARLVATICKNFTTSSNRIQSRMTAIYIKGLTEEKKAMASRYGALAGLGELGPEVIRTCILPHLKGLGENMKAATEGPITNAIDKIACEHIKKQLTKHVPKEIKLSGQVETLEEYVAAFGYLGHLLYNAVQKEQRPVGIMPAALPSSRPTLQIGNRVTQQYVLQSPGPVSTPLTPSTSAFFSSTGGAGGVATPRTPSTPSSAGAGPAPTQKILLMASQTSRSGVQELGTVAGAGGVAGGGGVSSATPTIVKVVSVPSGTTPGASGTTMQAGSGQKFVVIQGGNIKQETVQPSTPTLGNPTPASTPSMVVTTSQDMNVKSIFPTQQTAFSIALKKEEKS